jgi:hypothetical protein
MKEQQPIYKMNLLALPGASYIELSFFLIISTHHYKKQPQEIAFILRGTFSNQVNSKLIGISQILLIAMRLGFD